MHDWGKQHFLSYKHTIEPYLTEQYAVGGAVVSPDTQTHSVSGVVLHGGGWVGGGEAGLAVTRACMYTHY